MQETKRGEPLFSLGHWNVRECVSQYLPCANNGKEGVHNFLRLILSSIHPNTWHLYTSLKKKKKA